MLAADSSEGMKSEVFLEGKLTKSGSNDNGNDGAQFHGETTRRRHEGDAVTQVSHDAVTVGPDTDGDTGTAKGENPHGDVGLGPGDLAILPDLEDGGVRADSVGDVVGAVDKGGARGGQDLEEGVEELGAVVKVGGAGVDLLQVAAEDRVGLLGGDNVNVDAAEEAPLEAPEEAGGGVPCALGTGTDEASLLLRLGLLVVGPVGVGEVGIGGGAVGAGGLLALDALLALALEIAFGVGGGGALSTALIELLAGEVAVVEVADSALEVLGSRRDGTTLEQQRALEDVPGADLPVLLDDDAVEVREEEEGAEQSDTGADGDNDTGNLGTG